MTACGDRRAALLAALCVASSSWGGLCWGQSLRVKAQRPVPTPSERAIVQSLASNPATAPYVIGTSVREGRVVLSGRVATLALHDMVIQTALAVTPLVDDELVIDTAEAARALGSSGVNEVDVAPAYSAVSTYGSPPYLYPPPLFGRIDEPFYGFEPPVVSFPPWWAPMSRQRLGEAMAAAPDLVPEAQPPAPADSTPAPAREVEMTLDDQGVATLTGTVATEAQKVAVEQQVLQTSGVSRVVNNVTVEAQAEAPQPGLHDVPPPPRPGLPAPAARPEPPRAPVEPADAAREGAGQVQLQVHEALRVLGDDIATLVDVRVEGGVAFISGRVEDALQAMRVYRTVETLAGIDTVVDALSFDVPSDRAPNPLLGDPDRKEVEAYLTAQVKRHLGDGVTIDHAELGDRQFELRGRVADDVAADRAHAVLRSMAVLRGFDVRAVFTHR